MPEQNSYYVSDPAKLDNRQRGQLAELAFMRKAASLGFAVSKPWQEGERYDVIVRVDTIFWRVQVKSVLTTLSSGTSYRVKTTAGRQDRRACYSITEIDFLAAYIFEKDVWYIFPSSTIHNQQSVCLRPGSTKCRQLQYREAWDLMRPHSADAPALPPASETVTIL
jgi:hypothetical protein